jgi:hypothetical protein
LVVTATGKRVQGWLHRRQPAATDPAPTAANPAPAAQPFARAAMRLVINLNATGKASANGTLLDDARLDTCSPAPIDRATCSAATARTRPPRPGTP